MPPNEALADIWSKGVIEQNRRWLHAYLFAAVGDYHKAEDLVQETFEIAYRKRDTFQVDLSFGGWLRGIARNVLRRYRKEAGQEAVVVSVECLENLEGVAAEMESVCTEPEQQEQRFAALRACMSHLGEKTRRLLALHYVGGMTLKQVAARERMSESNAGVTIFRSRGVLAKCIAKRMAAEGEPIRK